MDDRRKKGEFVGALGALLVHVASTIADDSNFFTF